MTINGNKCLNLEGKSALKFSTKFIEQIESMKEKNYVLESAKVNFMMYWQKEKGQKEVKIILQELSFKK